LVKILPYVNNEHISNVYKYPPNYIKPNPSKNILKYNEKGIPYKNANYKYLEKNIVNIDGIDLNKKLPVIPNRKLSPIKRQFMKV
jgi:hypothetical protein